MLLLLEKLQASLKVKDVCTPWSWGEGGLPSIAYIPPVSATHAHLIMFNRTVQLVARPIYLLMWRKTT